jgi:site-specific DNA-cytosine methylase
MNILVACEESQRVCVAFRKKGHNAFSCDVIECSGGHPEWHIKQDVLPLLNGNCEFTTCDGTAHQIDGKWDMIIAHPPCTYLSNAGTRHFSLRVSEPQNVVNRWEKRAKAAVFFMCFILADCDKICVENPVGFMNTAYKKASQIIHPYMFATDENDIENYVTKRTCLWLKGLKTLDTNDLKAPQPKYICQGEKCKGKKIGWCEGIKGTTGGQVGRAKARSKTFSGIANAMAEQWG